MLGPGFVDSLRTLLQFHFEHGLTLLCVHFMGMLSPDMLPTRIECIFAALHVCIAIRLVGTQNQLANPATIVMITIAFSSA